MNSPTPSMNLPPGFRPALIEAGKLRREQRLPEATAVLEAALAEARRAPLDSPFQARVSLGMALADLYLATDNADRAAAMLSDEARFADRIVEAVRQDGTPEQLRAASAGRLQVRDRAVQVGMLGEMAPEIEVAEWALGEPTTLAELRGRVVLLEFWATWCGPCLEMFPRLIDLHARQEAHGLTVMALTHYDAPPGEDAAPFQARERANVARVVSERGLAFRVGIAADDRVQRRYGATAVPTLVAIDRRGRVRYASSSGDEMALQCTIPALLDEEP